MRMGRVWSGYGRQTYLDGTYEGHFRRGRFHGEGTIAYSSGRIVKGSWRDGRFLSKGKTSESKKRKFGNLETEKGPTSKSQRKINGGALKKTTPKPTAQRKRSRRDTHGGSNKRAEGSPWVEDHLSRSARTRIFHYKEGANTAALAITRSGEGVHRSWETWEPVDGALGWMMELL